jgi:hypothetical protein
MSSASGASGGGESVGQDGRAPGQAGMTFDDLGWVIFSLIDDCSEIPQLLCKEHDDLDMTRSSAGWPIAGGTWRDDF